MKIICSKTLLLNNINIAIKTTAVKSPRKILECILLSADEHGIVMTSYDNNMGIKTSVIKADVKKEGAVALDAKLLNEIIRKMPEGNISIECGENLVTMLVNNKAKFKIIGMDPELFPPFPDYEKDATITIKQGILRDLLSRTAFSIAENHNNAAFNGALMEYADNFFNIICIDGFRIAFARSLLNENDNVQTIVPNRAVKELMKIILLDKEDIKIIFSKNHIIFETNEFTFISKIISAPPFNYKQSFTVDHRIMVTINRNSFIPVLERCIIISGETKIQPVTLRFENNTLYVSSQSEYGSLKEELEIDMDGEPLEIAFNPRYLLESLRVCNEDEISMYMSTPLSACVLKNADNDDYKFLVLPLKV